MEYILDTHTFLWFIDGSQELSAHAREAIESPQNVKLVSTASFWEIAIKITLGKLKINMPFDDLENHVFDNGFQLLPISFSHIGKIIDLPLHHRDPFDRIIIAQAIFEKLVVIGKDPQFANYELTTIW
jgi:PIN domain nuclease of toxin-antitoxin system